LFLAKNIVENENKRIIFEKSSCFDIKSGKIAVGIVKKSNFIPKNHIKMK